MTKSADLSYQHMTDGALRSSMKNLLGQFTRMLSEDDEYPDIDYRFSVDSLIGVVIGTHKRKVYYRCLHNMEINEIKEAALYAYWIIKLKPFTIVDVRCIDEPGASAINELFALYVMSLALIETNRLADLCDVTEGFLGELKFAFRYRDISMGSMLLLFESINSETFAQWHHEDKDVV